nr:reverse transcriptase domain-containing protein [Tanacetum cinerariifolium]
VEEFGVDESELGNSRLDKLVLDKLEVGFDHGGTFMKRHPKECYGLTENIIAHHNDWDTSTQRRAYQGNSYQPQGNRNLLSYCSDNYLGPPGFNQNQNRNNQHHNFQNQNRNQGNPHPQGNIQGRNQFFQGAHQGQNQPPAYANQHDFFDKLKNMFGQFMKMNTASSFGSGTLSGNTITNLKEDLKGITTRSGTACPGPTIPTTSSPPVAERETEATKDTFGPSIESLFTNKDKLLELPRTSLNEHYSAVLLKKFPKKLGDPGKFLIPCDFPGMAECLAQADLGASINLMPLYMWNKLSLPDLSPMCMTLQLADRSISHPVGVAEDVFVKVEAFLNDDPSLPPPNQRNYLPEVRKELKTCEAKSDKSSIDEPLEEKIALITLLKSHKRAIAWKLSDIKGIDPEFCTHKILMEEDFESAVQH